MRWIAVIVAVLSVGMVSFYFSAHRFPKKGSDMLVVGFGGDTMLGRLVNEVLAVQLPAYPWGDLLSDLRATDINILNLETTLTEHTKAEPKVFNFRAEPDRVGTLVVGNIDVVSVANNHIGDFGGQGLRDTIATLDQAGIKHVGAGLNTKQARAPVIIKRNDITVGIIGATDNEPSWEAGVNKLGTFYFDVVRPEPLLAAIRQLKQQVDVVIVSLHWGPNNRQRPTKTFQDAAHAMIDAGASIIHGHSAHIFQGVEVYKRGLILYDTGDFVDDYAVNPLLRNDQTFFFKVMVRKESNNIVIDSLELIPAIISNMQVNRATGEVAHAITAKMRMLSIELGTHFGDTKETLRLAIA